MATELLEEGWYKFLRIYCKEGYLDRCVCDCIDNPNNLTKSNVQLNMNVCYWRCDDGKWVSDKNIYNNKLILLLEKVDEIRSIDIWEQIKSV